MQKFFIVIQHKVDCITIVVTDMDTGISTGIVMNIIITMNKKIKIMVVTGNGMSKLEKQIRDLGADDFLQKPVGMKELHQRIQILLSENIKR